MRRNDWKPEVSRRDGPAYLALADAIGRDIDLGLLVPGDMLPPQRSLAQALALDVSTVARAYTEASRRGLLEARVGAGTFVRSAGGEADARRVRRDLSDRSMNQPPEPDDPGLRQRMREVWDGIGPDMTALLRYQPLGGSAEDKAAALSWLSRLHIEAQADDLLITPGAHAALFAVLGELAAPGECVLCEAITYPGIRAISEALGIRLEGLPCDAHGIDPTAFASRVANGDVRALYLNPTLRNPTTETMPTQRRAEIVGVARHHGVLIVEDDAYGALLPNAPPAVAMLAPEITFYVGGLAKCLGAGLRLAYLIVPRPRAYTGVAARLKAATVMACPITTSLATRWIETGIADALLRAVQAESRVRQRMVAASLPSETVTADPDGFHVWVHPPRPWSRARIVDWMRGQSLGAVAADAFCVGIEAPEAFRLCLGGAATRAETGQALQFLADAFHHPPNLLQGSL
ncbi:MAG: PLP-dependent aminotransferase family protein [Pseudomonadota bacterium]